ncbi:MAG: FtsX-like permease family protein [Bacteroidota bacterium]
MLRNYLIIALRNMRRYLGFSFINLFGLGLGLAACLLILLFVNHERCFDRFHAQHEHVYRLNEVQTWDGIIPQKVALSMYPMGPNLVKDYPEIQAFTRMINRTEVPLDQGDKRIFLDKLYLVDSAFTDIFDFPWLYGEESTALLPPNSIVITEETAIKFFGRTDVVGEQLADRNGDTTMFNITGVVKNVPAQSHLQFDGLISMSTVGEETINRWMENWGSNWLNTYLKLAEGVDIKNLETKFPDFLIRYMGEDAPEGYQLFLQNLADIHLGSTEITHDYQNEKKFNGTYITVFTYLGLFVLLIAAINFMNLTTARSQRRAKEVGIRKTIGGTRRNLAGQFLMESLVFAAFAMLLALAVTGLALPWLNDLAHREISMVQLLQPSWIAGILGGTLVVGLLAGVYPALFISGFQPAEILKGATLFRDKRVSLQNVLVVLQFSIASALIVGTILTAQQLYFMLGKDAGFNREQVMLLPTDRNVNQGFEAMKNELLTLPGVKAVTASGQRLGNNIHQTGISFRDDSASQGLSISHLNIDYDYLSFYEIELLDGRDFSESYASDAGQNFIINETLAKKIGWEDPVGKDFKFSWNEDWGKVVGVVKDFNYNSLHEGINPLALSIQPWGYSEVQVKLKGDQVSSQLAEIERVWRASGTELPFDYTFLDAHFAEIYESDRQASEVVLVIAGLAVLIACMGLFGLITISAERRTKEVGIRKVLGASVVQVMGLFAKEVSLLVLLSVLIAVPVTWYFMESWLQNYAYRIEIGAGVFILAGLGALLIALLTISFRAYRSAVANPVDALRSE